MRRPLRRLAFVILVSGPWAVALSGCKQGEGERCEVDRDCSSGLVCDVNNVCRHPDRIGLPPDADLRQDAVAPEVAPDGASGVETGPAPADGPGGADTAAPDATHSDVGSGLGRDGAPEVGGADVVPPAGDAASEPSG
jgi:hypothetical protein